MTTDDPNLYAPPTASPPPNPREAWPWWVRFGMFGIKRRRTLWVHYFLSYASAVGFFVYGFWDWRSFVVAGASLWSALMYWLAIRWLDRHGAWSASARAN